MSDEKLTTKHIEQVLHHPDNHKKGLDEGCVTHCVWSKKPGDYVATCDFEGHNHLENGRAYHFDKDRKWYNLDFSVEGPARARLERELRNGNLVLAPKKPDPRRARAQETWWMKEKGGKNANFGRQGKPWAFNGHHIIPVASLRNAFRKLNDPVGMLVLLQKNAKYNINHGINIMFLPVTEVYARIYELPAHLALPTAKGNQDSNHTVYNKLVERRLDTIVDSIREAEDQGEDHPALDEVNLGGQKTELEDFSEAMRQRLRAMGVARSKANQLRGPKDFISHTLDTL